MSIIKDKLAAEGLAGATGDNNPDTDKNQPPAGDQQQQQQQAASTDDDVDIDDAKLLKAFNKKHNTAFTSLDEIKPGASQSQPQLTPEQIEAQKAEKRTKARAYGLAKNLVTSDDLDSH